MNVVDHIQLVLDKVRIWINLLSWIMRKILAFYDLGTTIVVRTSCPRLLVTIGATHAHE